MWLPMSNKDVELKQYCGPFWGLVNDPTVVKISLSDLDDRILMSRFGVEKELVGIRAVKAVTTFIRYCSSKSVIDHDHLVPIDSSYIPSIPH